MPAELAHGQEIQAVNFVLETNRGLLEVCHLSFSEADESLYLRPVAPTGHFRYGMDEIPAGASSAELSLVDRGESRTTPAKLSIHGSGQVHIKLDLPRSPIVAGPVFGPPLAQMNDDHIASIAFDDFGALRPVTRTPTTRGPTADLAFPFGAEPSGRIAFYANAHQAAFNVAPYYLKLNPARGNPLYVGLAHMPNAPLGPDPGIGFTVLSGWDTASDLHKAASFVWMRCS